MSETEKAPNRLPEVTGISASVYNSLYSYGWDINLNEKELAENHLLLTNQINAQVKEIRNQLEEEKQGRCLTDPDWVKRTENACRFKLAQLTVLDAWRIKHKDLYQKYSIGESSETASVIQKVLEILIPYINIPEDQKQTVVSLLATLAV